jgi:hypothetical protein
MADAYVIEVHGDAAGIIARDHSGDAFTFFASHPFFHALEGKRFAAPWAATRAAQQLFEQADKSRRKPPRAPASEDSQRPGLML